MDKEMQKQVAAVVNYIAHRKAPLVEFAPDGPFARAVEQAVTAGYLTYVGNGVVQLTDEWKQQLSREKDPEGAVLVHMAAKAFVEALEAQGLPTIIDINMPNDGDPNH